MLSKAAFAMLAMLAAVHANPIAAPAPASLQVRANPLAKCLTNSDGPAPGPNSYCQQAYTDPGFTSGFQKVPFGESYVTKKTALTAGPMHCCARCENDAQCLGWEIDDDCSCHIFTTPVSCPAPRGTFGTIGSAQSNVTGTYHLSKSTCNFS